ncbi:MAG: hypothetical protein K2Q01_11195, partial [Rickettsiales bacterium]|nr:hypothetical protein [Rickettsiales bacterium]
MRDANTETLYIRWLNDNEHPEVLPRMAAVDKACSRNPFTLPDFRDRFELKNTSYRGMLLENDAGDVVGYVLY